MHICISCDKTFHVVIIFLDLVTFTLKFDLLLKKKFNLGHNFQTRSGTGRAFILRMSIPCVKNHSRGTIMFDLVTLTLKFDLLLKKIVAI